MAALEKFFLYRYIIAASIFDYQNFWEWAEKQTLQNRSTLKRFTKCFRKELKDDIDKYLNAIKGNGSTITKFNNDLFMGRLTALDAFS